MRAFLHYVWSHVSPVLSPSAGCRGSAKPERAGAASEYPPIWLACSPAWRTEGSMAREAHPTPVTETAGVASLGSLRASAGNS